MLCIIYFCKGLLNKGFYFTRSSLAPLCCGRDWRTTGEHRKYKKIFLSLGLTEISPAVKTLLDFEIYCYYKLYGGGGGRRELNCRFYCWVSGTNDVLLEIKKNSLKAFLKNVEIHRVQPTENANHCMGIEQIWAGTKTKYCDAYSVIFSVFGDSLTSQVFLYHFHRVWITRWHDKET